MSTSDYIDEDLEGEDDEFDRLPWPPPPYTGPEAASVELVADGFRVVLSDGRVARFPFDYTERLRNATPAQRGAFEWTEIGIHWEEIDEDISIAGIVRDFGAELPKNGG
jgi:hypothetical protein